MRTLAIRELTGPALRRAAEDDEVIGITNDRILAGVLIPISRDWVEQLVEQNLSRVVQNVRRGEQEIASILQSEGQDGGDSSRPRFTTLDDMPSQPSAGIPRHMRRVNLRDMSGSVLQRAAEQNEAIVLTTDRVVAALIYPVNQDWVAELVEQNLSRVLHNLTIGEKELNAQHQMTTLDDVV